MGYGTKYYEEVDEGFAKLRGDPFKSPLADPLAQPEREVGPVGWVENADADDGLPSVTIDADGITIRYGKLFLEDYGGASVLGPAGFAGSWINFMHDRVYNSHFQYGTLDADLVLSEVSGGNSISDYADSLSAELPYWVVVENSGSHEQANFFARIITDETASYNRALYMTGLTFTFQFYQDVPVVPGIKYNVGLNWRYANYDGSEFSRTIMYSWRDSDHAIIGVGMGDGLSYTTSQDTYAQEADNAMEGSAAGYAAPERAAYLRVEYEFARIAGNPSVWINNISVQPSVLMGAMAFTGDKIGFYGTDPIVKPSVGGAKGGNVALTNLCNVLQALGLLTNNTT